MSDHLIEMGMDEAADRLIRAAAWQRKKAKRKKRNDFDRDHDERGAEESPHGPGKWTNERYQRNPRRNRNRKNATMGRSSMAY